MDDSTKGVLGVGIVLGGIGVALGFGTASVWAGLLVPIALFGVLVVVVEAQQGEIALLWGGGAVTVLVLLLAMWLAGGRGQGWWIATWVFVGSFALVVTLVNRRDPDYRHVAVFGVLCLCVPVAWLYAGIAISGVASSGWIGRFEATAMAFMSGTFTSVWGVLSLAVVAALGWTWARLRGALAFPMALFFAVAVMGALQPAVADTAIAWLRASPVERVASLLSRGPGLLGAPATGVALVGIGLALALGGATRLHFVGMVEYAEEYARRRAAGRSLDPSEFAGEEYVIRGTVASWIGIALVGGALVTVWLALHRLAAAGPVTAFPRWAWDLARPDVRPELLWGDVALALSNLVLLETLRRQPSIAELRKDRSAPLAKAAVAGAGTLAAALLVPAGVLVTSAAAGVTQILWARLVTISLTPRLSSAVAAALQPSAEEDSEAVTKAILERFGGPLPEEPQQEQQLEPEREREPEPEPTRAPPEAELEPEPRFREVFHVSRPVLDVAPLIGGGIAVLQDDGVLSRWHDGEQTGFGREPVEDPLGLVPSAEGRVVLVEAAGRMVELEFDNRGLENTHACATGPVRCFAGKPFGAQVAFAGPDGVSAFVIQEDVCRTLVDDIDGVRALAYSADGRFLACARDDGTVIVVDLRTKSRKDLEDPGSPAARLAASPLGWVGALEDKRVILWQEQGAIAATWRLGGLPTCLAVDPRNGDVAVGGSRGHVRVRSADLRSTLFDEKVLEGRVNTLASADEGLIVAGASGVGVVVM
jgi:hypothetical protein